MAYSLQCGKHLQEAEEVLRPLTRSDRPEGMQAGIRIWIAELLIAQGKLEADREDLKAVATLDSAA